MADKKMHSWLDVSTLMNDDYRELVIKDALTYLPAASTDLKKTAKDGINRTVQINGFRLAVNAPLKKLRQQVSVLFRKNKTLVPIIISLWAEKEKKLIEFVQKEAVKAEIPLDEKWNWADGMLGYYDYDDIPELHQLAISLGEKKDSPEKDHLLLAVLWLSRQLFRSEKVNVESETKLELDSTERIEVSKPVRAPQTAEDIEYGSAIHPSLNTAELEQLSIGKLSQYWEIQFAEIIEARDLFLTKIDELKVTTLNTGLAHATEMFKQLENDRRGWEILQRQSEVLVDYIQTRISRELQLRPDIKIVRPEVAELSEDPTEDELVAILPTIFKAIEKYDENKSRLILEAKNLRDEMLKMEESLSLWQNDVTTIQHQLKLFTDYTDFTTHQLQSGLDTARKVIQECDSRRLKSRQISIGRILETASKIIELSRGVDVLIVEQNLKDLNESMLQEMSGRKLQEIEREILAVFAKMIKKNESGNSRKLASQLKNAWSEDALSQLMQSITVENRNIEAALLEMASVAVHPRTDRADYEPNTARGLFKGVLELSADGNPYCLLNDLASNFFLGWTSSDVKIRCERCILSLVAQANSETGLPKGFLWQVETDWPDGSMISWDRLWQAVLLEDDIQIYTDEKVLELQGALDSKKKDIEMLFAKDGGHFQRMSSVKSDRHRSMMANHIMPVLLGYYDGLSKLRNHFESDRPEKHNKLMGELIRAVDALEKSLTEKKLAELYEKGARADGIDDETPFHPRICLRIMSELTEAIRDYGSALLNLENIKSSRKDGLNYQNLVDEASKHLEMSMLIRHAVDQIVNGSLKSGAERNEESNMKEGARVIVARLLRDSSFIQLLPQTICSLVNEEFSWNRLLQSLLDDLEMAHDVSSAVEILLGNRATHQVLQVVQQLPLEQQKQAQAMHRDQEKHLSDLEDEFMRLGGDNEWAKLDHELGRWGYLSSQLTEEISRLKQKTVEEHRRIEAESVAIREQINRLDMNIFKSRSNIPVHVFGILQNGLNVARKVCEVPLLYPQVRDYLDEVEYRINRESWIDAELDDATQNLEKKLLGIRDEENISMGVGQIISAFNAGELKKLGLDIDDFEDSKVTTRVNILDNWLAIKNLRTIIADKLMRVEINKIKSLYSYFARMQQMNRSRGSDQNYMSYENPIVHEYWALRFPRTPALAKQCVMIALPGDPPSADDLQSLDEFLEKEDFLAAHFVFLFVPGCTPKIAKRINQNYAKQGLVLIDEDALIRIVLAERESSIVPLGKLRPLMLNSTGANADIFTVNQSVNSHTSIFFGRDPLIDRIASSGDNYAIYGGRRIGKSSVLKALEQLLEIRDIRVVSYSLEGESEYSEEYISRRLASQLKIQKEYELTKDLKSALFAYFEENPEESIVLILDEIDRYISENRDRHTLIETLRATSDSFEHRFRVIIAGFMELYDCLSGRGPYTPTSDPWGRMLNNMGPLENLKPADAEKIIREGFLSILGWSFEHRAIPRRIVERTGGHPAFVQYFCLKLQEQVGKRGNQIVTLKDIDTVFDDNTPEKSFIWFVRKTLEMNLSDPTYKRQGDGKNISDPVSRYLLLWLAIDAGTNTAPTFTFDQIREIVNLSKVQIPEKVLMRSLELLTVTSVVREKSSQLYEFTVPDYPLILNRLGEGGSQLEALEAELKAFLESDAI